MKSKLIYLLSVFKKHLRESLIHMGGLLPLLLVLDYGMGIQLHRDYDLKVVLGFISALVLYAVVYARYIHDR